MWAILLSLISTAYSGTPEQWKSRTIYQIVTDRFSRGDGNNSGCSDLRNYCGGTFKGIKDNLDYVQNMGFDAIWISPVVKNYPGSYHGYHAIDFYHVNEHFGSSDDLKDLVSECHSRGIWVMLDVVANHVGPVGHDFSQVSPFNQAAHYHSECSINNWNDQHEVEYCWLAGLPDLAQENDYVKSTLVSWINWIVGEFSIDGLRVDTAVEVPKWFWKEFTDSSGVYTVGEAFNGDYSYVAGYQGSLDGMLNYPLFFAIRNAFQSGQNMQNTWQSFEGNMKVFPDQTILGNFVDNHDNARFLNGNSNTYRFKNALAWSLMWTGIPIVYYGDEQGFNGGNDPYCREILWPYLSNTSSDLYKFVSTTVKFRKEMKVWEQGDPIERYAQTNFYCFSRGKALACFSNSDNTQNYELDYHPYSPGDVVCDVYWEGDCVTVTSDNKLSVVLLHGENKLYKPKTSILASR